MFRLLFVMVTTVLIGLGSGYFLWGTRVARMTEAMSGLTLEIDTLKARQAAPQAAAAAEPEGAVKATDELHAINESVAAMRQELADQKALIEKQAQAAAALPPDVEKVTAELRTTRNELAGCIADKQDLEARCAGRPNAAPAAPTAPPAPPSYLPR